MIPSVRGTRRLGAAIAASAMAITIGAACEPQPPGPPVEIAVFDVPGAHAWTVPSGVTYITVGAYGASGGGADPGLGASVLATIPVTEGQIYTIVVAGEGGDHDRRTPGAGGIGGGAPGGTGGLDPCAGTICWIGVPDVGGDGGDGGGGASDLRTGPADDSGLATRILVAAGGGGTARTTSGGDGGLDGGAGGDGSGAFGDYPNHEVVVLPGGVGGAGPSGAGATGEIGAPGFFGSIGLWAYYGGHGGGGGGGGLTGGGGGRSAARLYAIESAAGPGTDIPGVPSGGGGGSSLVPADAVCPGVVEDGVRTGNGLVLILTHRTAAPPVACD